MKKSLLVILGIMLIGITSCEYNYVVPIEVEVGSASFSEDVQPIFNAKCATCHASTKPVLTEGNAYDNLTDGYVNTSDPESSSLYVKVKDGHPGGSSALGAEELAIILKWIEDGAKND